MRTYCNRCYVNNGPHKKPCVFYPQEAKLRDKEIEQLQAKSKRQFEVIGEVAIERDKLQAENKNLKEFARHVIETECWSLYEQDGCELQELAEKLGLIKSQIATENDIDDESDFEIGDKIYKFTEVLKGGD